MKNAFKTVTFLSIIGVIIVSLSVIGLNTRSNQISDAHADVLQSHGPVIVIDPGHGGEDGGAEANGVLEKDINLKISQMLKGYLSLSCYESVMTRTDDRLLYNPGEEANKKRYDITNRVKFTESIDGAVFVSIHQNKFQIPKYKGLQVYYSAKNSDSKVLSELIQKNARAFLDNQNNRQVKEADFRIRVLDMLQTPAVLVECGFLSNEEEANLLSSNDYQKKVAFTIYLSLLEYLEKTE